MLTHQKLVGLILRCRLPLRETDFRWHYDSD